MASNKRKATDSICGEPELQKVKTSHSSPLKHETTEFQPNTSSLEKSVVDELNRTYTEVHESLKEKCEVDVPESISILQFAQCRASEIATILQEVECKRPKQSLQQLPYHMRRRAASHNANRVPRRLREKALKEIQKAKKSKCPSRKHRRRPTNLLLEYNRRQKEFVWLETHIWFAKRFKIAKLWGYKIPLHPNDKSVRASYRASARHVLIQDLSYLCCIELKGLQSLLLSELCNLTKTLVGLTFASKMYLSGTREGNTVLYHPHDFPNRAIGPVSFLWEPLPNSNEKNGISTDENIRKLWIWCHPIMHQELIDVFKKLFHLKVLQTTTVMEKSDICFQIHEKGENKQLSPCEVNQDEMKNKSKILLTPQITASESKIEAKDLQTVVPSSTKDSNSNLKLCDKKFEPHFQKTIVYAGNNVTMTLLKDTLVRHRLIGPLSQAVLTDALKIADTSSEENSLIWNQIQAVISPDELPPGLVVGLTVKDPRIYLPKMKEKVTSNFQEHCKAEPNFFLTRNSSDLSYSPLWDQNIRDEVTATKQPESQLNKIRSQFLVPGTTLDLGEDESRIPVILIQQPGTNGYSSGWDIIAPLGWSMPFWIAFIYRGARASGLRELCSVAQEAGCPLFPYNFPDTHSGKVTEETNRKEMMEKHFRYPPDKRPSFSKFGIVSPFFMPWERLVAEWKKEVLSNATDTKVPPGACSSKDFGEQQAEVTFSKTSIQYYVLRSRSEIKLYKTMCDLLVKLSKQKSQLSVGRALLDKLSATITNGGNSLQHSLICVKLKMLNKGKPSRYSGLYLPSNVDLLNVKKNMNYAGPVEPIHPVKRNRKKELKKKASFEHKNLPTDKKACSAQKALLTDNEDERLSRPVINTLISHCSRKMMGFLDVGDFSYLNACGTGIGHCSLLAFLKMLKMCLDVKLPPTVLVRSQNNLQYRLATVDLVEKLF